MWIILRILRFLGIVNKNTDPAQDLLEVEEVTQDIQGFQGTQGFQAQGTQSEKKQPIVMEQLKIDKPSLDKISKLHPSVREEMKKIINEINTNKLTGRSQVRVSQGLRTFAEQDALYAKRPKVTNAKGGQSIHNYGFAVDIVLIIDGKVASWDVKKDWDSDGVADWDECVLVFAKYGWNWGGNWHSFKDMPHFDKIGYSNWKILKNYKRDKDGYIIIS